MRKAIKKLIVSALVAATAGGAAMALTGCVQPEEIEEFAAEVQISNGGFETGDISGWTIERGDAFDDDSVSSAREFFFPDDADHKMIPIDQTGNWYLSGKGYDGKRPHGYTGSIRSSVFTLGGDGTVSMKLAGGALVTRKGENAPAKRPEKTCYVGVYRLSDDMMIAKFTNKYFLEHTEDYVNVYDYTSGTCITDNFYRYQADLSDYLGEKMYIRIVDNDTDTYYGYISVDDIRIGGADPQVEGPVYAKTRDISLVATAPSKYEIANGDFEEGSLAGWTVVSGDAFSNDGVTNVKYWWNESIPYDRDGNYHYGHYKPQATGVMRSSDFELGGCGYISYKLGGCSSNSLTYLRFLVKVGNDYEEVARFSNFMYWNYQFPYVQNGMRLLNLVQYYTDFSAYIGQTMCIEVVDENASSDELGCITLDSVQTYYEQVPQWYTTPAFRAVIDPDLRDVEVPGPYQVTNGTFETGDLTGWTMKSTAYLDDDRNVVEGDIGVVSDAAGWWYENFPYNKKGRYLFTGISHEKYMGTLTSSEFELGGCGWISYRLGGGHDPSKCYLSVIDSATGKELARFANSRFLDNGTSSLNSTSYLANMISYRADLVSCGIPLGTKLKLRIVDNATNSWGLITADSFITYYETEAAVPKAYLARNILTAAPTCDAKYLITNGGFETGDLTGWSYDTDVVGGGAVIYGDNFWNERLPYNNGGNFHFDGLHANADESVTYTLKSTEFELGGAGYISFKMAGRTAAVRVYKAGATPELIAEYKNTAFKDKNFPYIDDGCRLGTMTTFVADLSDHIGETLYVELCDLESETDDDGNALSWCTVFFDDIMTYYETAPDIANGYDVVYLDGTTSYYGADTYNIAWVEAVNTLEEGN